MVDGLAAVGSGIHDKPVALVEILLSGDLRCGGEQVPEQLCILGGCVRERSKVLLGNDQDVDRRLRVDVGEGNDLLVLEETGDRDRSRGDLAEKAIGRRSKNGRHSIVT